MRRESLRNDLQDVTLVEVVELHGHERPATLALRSSRQLNQGIEAQHGLSWRTFPAQVRHLDVKELPVKLTVPPLEVGATSWMTKTTRGGTSSGRK